MKYEYTHEKLLKYNSQAQKVYAENSYKFSKEYLIEKCNKIDLKDEHRQALENFIDYLQTDEELKRYIWTFYYVLFETEEILYKNLYGINGLSDLEMPKGIQDEFPGYSYSVLFLIAEDNLIEFLNKTDYDRQLIESIVNYFWFKYKEFSEIDYLNYNTYGLKALWPHLYTYAKPSAFRLGRLIYQVTTFKEFCEVYEYNGDKKIIAIPTVKYDNNGHFKANGNYEPVYEIKENILTANTYDENGLIQFEPIKLDLTKYKKILSSNDTVLTIHIPSDGKLLDEDVKQSLDMAKEAINGVFKKYEIKGLVSHTWLLDTQLKEVLKESSNIISFQKNFHIVLTEENTVHSLCNHVFNVKDDADFNKLVPTNSFQKSMLERVKNGKKIYLGYGIIK